MSVMFQALKTNEIWPNNIHDLPMQFVSHQSMISNFPSPRNIHKGGTQSPVQNFLHPNLFKDGKMMT